MGRYGSNATPLIGTWPGWILWISAPVAASWICRKRVFSQYSPAATASSDPSGENAAAATAFVSGNRYATSPSGTRNTGTPVLSEGRLGSRTPCDAVTAARSPRGDITTRVNPPRISDLVVT